MRSLLFAVALLLPVAAHAQPACIPGFYGKVLDVNAPRRSDAGWRIVWACEVDGKPVGYTLVCVHGTCSEQLFRDSIFNATQSSDPIASIKAAWQKNAGTDPCVGAVAPMKTVCDQATADAATMLAKFALPEPPPPPPPPPAATWTVAPTTFGSRPTYVWDGTTRGSTAPERVNVGEPCDPAVGSGSYRGVLGRTDRVAFCVEVKP